MATRKSGVGGGRILRRGWEDDVDRFGGFGGFRCINVCIHMTVSEAVISWPWNDVL